MGQRRCNEHGERKVDQAVVPEGEWGEQPPAREKQPAKAARAQAFSQNEFGGGAHGRGSPGSSAGILQRLRRLCVPEVLLAESMTSHEVIEGAHVDPGAARRLADAASGSLEE
jgi:hypothetical protein